MESDQIKLAGIGSEQRGEAKAKGSAYTSPACVDDRDEQSKGAEERRFGRSTVFNSCEAFGEGTGCHGEVEISTT